MGGKERGTGWIRPRTQTPNGTIYRTVYNSLGEAVSGWVGTDDTPTSGEWSPSNNTGTANMVEVRSYQYDNGGVGDGNLTQETDYPGLGAANRVTNYWYDWRDRLVAQKSGVESDGKKGRDSLCARCRAFHPSNPQSACRCKDIT